jgi:hypothetical protein
MLYRVLAFLLGLVLIAIGWRELRYGWAEQQLAKQLDALQVRSRTESVDTFAADFMQLDQQIEQWEAATVLDGNWSNLRGRSALLGADFIASTPKEKNTWLRRARDAFVRARERKPSFPHAWLNAARVQFELDRNGPWREYLLAAIDRGVRAPSLQRDLLLLRISLGERVDAELAQRLDQSLALALRDGQLELIPLAMSGQRGDIICLNAKFTVLPTVQRACQIYLGS